MKRVIYYGAMALGVVALPIAAIASHGKVGLWEVTTTMNIAGMPAMPDMSKLPPEAQAQMRKMGIQMQGNSITAQHCMTPSEVAQDMPPSMEHMKTCTTQHLAVAPGMMNVDMVCTGKEMSGTGHVAVTYSGNTSYTGRMNFTGTADGHPMSMSNTFTGRWISADCGGVAH